MQPDGVCDAYPPPLPRVAHDASHRGAVLVAGDVVAKPDDVASVAAIQFCDQRQPPRVDIGQRAEKRVRQDSGRRVKSQVSRLLAQTHEQPLNGGMFAGPKLPDVQRTAARECETVRHECV
jgi:hypothetical protein